MFGYYWYKSMKDRMLEVKLIEIKDNKINLFNCKDIDTMKAFQSCVNRKQKRIALAEYYKEFKKQNNKQKRLEISKYYNELKNKNNT